MKALVQMQRTTDCFKSQSSLKQSSNISMSATLIHRSHILRIHINSHIMKTENNATITVPICSIQLITICVQI